MERKIGEIFEYDGEWYQCINTGNCSECAFTGKRCYDFSAKGVDIIGDCTGRIFKKLERVGEPYEKRVSDGTFSKFQRYKVYASVILPKEPYIYCNFIDSTVEIEIKQNKEDMEDLDKIKVRDYTKVEEFNVMEENKLNLKPFDIQKAREGKPVCTRDGRKARIICFDAKMKRNIIALIQDDKFKDEEIAVEYFPNGCFYDNDFDTSLDLMMLPEKRSGWVNIVRGSNGSPHMGRGIFQSKEEAENAIKAFSDNLIDTVKISWEE